MAFVSDRSSIIDYYYDFLLIARNIILWIQSQYDIICIKKDIISSGNDRKGDNNLVRKIIIFFINTDD